MWKCWVTAVRSFHRQVWGLAWPLWLTLILTFVTVRLLWNTLKPLPLPNTPLFRLCCCCSWMWFASYMSEYFVGSQFILRSRLTISLCINRVKKGTKTGATVHENLDGWVKTGPVWQLKDCIIKKQSTDVLNSFQVSIIEITSVKPAHFYTPNLHVGARIRTPEQVLSSVALQSSCTVNF